MASLAAYIGLRWGELTALTTGQVDPAARVITVDRKVVEINGQMFVEAPKNPSSAGRSTPASHRLLPALVEEAACRILN
jgi:hypothetical protein